MSKELLDGLWFAGAMVAAYLVGSLSFAVIVSRLMGLSDPRSYGSRNPGATNVLRSGNRKAAILTLVFDALKGYVPVALAAWFGPQVNIGEGKAAFIGLAFLRFEMRRNVLRLADLRIDARGVQDRAAGPVDGARVRAR